MLAEAGRSNLKLNMMILKEPGPVEARGGGAPAGLQEGGHQRQHPGAAGTQWFDRLYTKRNHDGIAVNAGIAALPMGADRQLHDEGDAAQEPAEVPEGRRFPASRPPTTLAFSPANEAQYALALKTIQRLMLSQAAVFHTMMASNQNVAPQNLLGVDSTLIGDQRFDGAYFCLDADDRSSDHDTEARRRGDSTPRRPSR